ncbi:MAG TPA: TraB/GumN family protein [Allosphingosinicella sp.]|nr:TraB/GumN family protein [Allosphingosinicella sp.]
MTFYRPAWLLALAALASPASAVPAGAEAAKDVRAAKAAPGPQTPAPQTPAPQTPGPQTPGPQAEPRPALWLLADEDTRIYMFGTIHVLPPGFRWRSAALDKAVVESSELVVETYDAPGAEASAEASAEIGAGFFADKAVPILQRVPKKKRKPLKAAIEASGVPMPVLDRMHSWAAAMTLGIAQMLDQYGVDDPDDAPGVEDVLEETFRGAGKPISSVEDGNAVMASMSALPEAVQIQLLLESIAPAEGDGGAPAMGTEEVDWVAGRSEALDVEVEGEFPPALFDVLVRKRNAAWTSWLEERLKKPGTLLFAVGAGHFAGRESVQSMLARRGLEVKRID